MNAIGSLAAAGAVAALAPAGARAIDRGVRHAVQSIEQDVNAGVRAVGSVVTGATGALVSGADAIGRGGRAIGRIVDVFA